MTFDKIKERLEQLKLLSAKAEVRTQQIKEQWEKEFGTSDVSEVKQKLLELQDDLKKTREDYMTALEKAEAALIELESK